MRRDIFQAIADPTRRAIITLIALQAMTPNAIANNFNTTRQSVSKHLRILIECELVKQEQKGREIYFTNRTLWCTGSHRCNHGTSKKWKKKCLSLHACPCQLRRAEALTNKVNRPNREPEI